MLACSRLVIVAVALSGSLAHAGPRAADVAAAERAFQDGRDLMKHAKFAQACTRFEDSNRLDPQFGTRYNLADCYEKLGRLDKALEIYEDLAEHDDYAPRRAKAKTLADSVRPRISWLRIDLAPRAPSHLEITLDGVDVTAMVGDSRPVALGGHELRARADGFKPWMRRLEIRDEGSRMTTEVRLVANPKASRVAVTSANDHRKSYATWTLVGAGALLAGGAVFGGLAYKTWGDARDVCGGVACATMDELDRGTALSNRATDYAHAADALVIVGVAAAVVGVTLWVTSPPERGVAIAARANRDGAGLLLVGRW